ncbi:MAG: hypothetical protein PHG85_04350 [Candidatus Altiarchaeota archaeon]|nr:hypothetical protein [Candidatus Altiarchaeota archaeon]
MCGDGGESLRRAMQRRDAARMCDEVKSEVARLRFETNVLPPCGARPFTAA